MLRDFTIFGYALIPLDLAAHMAHNLFHLLGEGLAVPRSMVLWLGGTWEGSTALLNTMTIEVLQYLMLGRRHRRDRVRRVPHRPLGARRVEVAGARSAAPARRAARGDQRLHVRAADGPSGVGRRATSEYRGRRGTWTYERPAGREAHDRQQEDRRHRRRAIRAGGRTRRISRRRATRSSSPATAPKAWRLPSA